MLLLPKAVGYSVPDMQKAKLTAGMGLSLGVVVVLAPPRQERTGEGPKLGQILQAEPTPALQVLTGLHTKKSLQGHIHLQEAGC